MAEAGAATNQSHGLSWFQRLRMRNGETFVSFPLLLPMLLQRLNTRLAQVIQW